MNKVFAIGFHKMGTTSLNRLFNDMGLRSSHSPYHTWKDINYFLHADYFTDGEEHDFRWLHNNFPESQFILLDRNVNDWVESRIKFVKWCRYPPIMKIVGEYQKDPDQAVKDWKTRYYQYRSDVLDYFKGNLLQLNVCEDSPEKLYEYIGIRGMDKFPHVNKANG